MLLIAVALSGYATVDRHLPASLFLRLGSVNAEGLVQGQGGQVSGVNVGRLSTIVKPITAPSSALKSHAAFNYTVKDGEDLPALARKFGVSVEDIRWSNSALTDTDWVGGGTVVVMPPVPGVVALTHPGDTVVSLAATYKVDPQVIIDFNYLRDPSTLTSGLFLVIPGGTGGPLTTAAELPIPADPAAVVPGRSTGPSQVAVGGAPGSLRNSRFPYGYCTWYVATKRNVTWFGDAWQWYGNARAQGLATGSTPRPGAIMVTWESGWGHVGYVESVNSDGSYVISEMNYAGWAVVDHRTIRPGGVPLIGFIY